MHMYLHHTLFLVLKLYLYIGYYLKSDNGEYRLALHKGTDKERVHWIFPHNENEV